MGFSNIIPPVNLGGFSGTLHTASGVGFLWVILVILNETSDGDINVNPIRSLGRVPKKTRENCALLTNQGGGGSKKTNLYFGKVFFQ